MLQRRVLAGLFVGLVVTGCANTTAVRQTSSATSAVRTVQVSETFQADASGAAVTYDPELVPAGARGAVQARSGDGTTTVMLAVRGLQPLRWYGAHVHAKPCGEAPEHAGPHFQYSPDPVQPSVDPRFANPQNEIWLDLTTDETGSGSTESTVAWQIPSEQPRPGSVVIHAAQTATDAGKAGTAGARAACIDVDF